MWKGIWWQFCGCDQNKSLPVCEKEPISDYPCVTIYHRRGAGKKISSTLANLLPSHNSSYYVDDIDIGVKYRPIDWNCWETTFNWEICRFYRTSSFWLNLNGKCVLWWLLDNDGGGFYWMVAHSKHFITCTYPSCFPTYQCGLGKAIRFNVHAVYAVYGSLWLGNTPTLVNPWTTSEWWGKTATGASFHFAPARHSHTGSSLSSLDLLKYFYQVSVIRISWRSNIGRSPYETVIDSLPRPLVQHVFLLKRGKWNESWECDFFWTFGGHAGFHCWILWRSKCDW